MAIESQISNLKSQILFLLPSKLAKIFSFTAILFLFSTTVFSRHYVNNSYAELSCLSATDTPQVALPDSLKAKETTAKDTASSSDALKTKVVYSARDSLRMDAENEKVYLYGEA